MTPQSALLAPRIFDGETWHTNAAVLMANGDVDAIVQQNAIPSGLEVTEIDTGFIAPGFVDLQVNGGGGVMLNDHRDADAIRTICAAHASFGTTALLATLITDTPTITAEAIAAGAEAARRQIPGFLGLHLEGPHLSIRRKGAHDPHLIRPMEEDDLIRLIAARDQMPVLLTTVATESVAPHQIKHLAGAGLIVSLGHSNANYADVVQAAKAGASMATHLFNAMSQIENRAPGLVGASIALPSLWAGLIADGIHVDPINIGIALRAKPGPARIFLVTDAMATIGTDMREFKLNGRVIKRHDGRLTLEDGTLAGADLDMISAVRFMRNRIGITLEEALRMASLYPAMAVGMDHRHGRLGLHTRADMVVLDDELGIGSVWIGGQPVYRAPARR
ncbi:N-acetylglucosamine-6-phosphate deacetylase [Methylovirgula sp. 4M-Z18]|uniref:N-acetylglucosamine-6-phosphate deacetylase n=1 Tax=Methylovirgula sp. 4M-Z18 TaxID=2293567 RepID=UPI000E2E64F4|nr:N-acetylglucosamine-6-phosphate deacetylase [Methylovirgula sp. 4M-Z18]RFB79877.1 N-acetylglucosamine-6-phosphate deacetylase [Methylovirgula sp. 4M-Z18]